MEGRYTRLVSCSTPSLLRQLILQLLIQIVQMRAIEPDLSQRPCTTFPEWDGLCIKALRSRPAPRWRTATRHNCIRSQRERRLLHPPSLWHSENKRVFPGVLQHRRAIGRMCTPPCHQGKPSNRQLQSVFVERVVQVARISEVQEELVINTLSTSRPHQQTTPS